MILCPVCGTIPVLDERNGCCSCGRLLLMGSVAWFKAGRGGTSLCMSPGSLRAVTDSPGLVSALNDSPAVPPADRESVVRDAIREAIASSVMSS